MRRLCIVGLLFLLPQVAVSEQFDRYTAPAHLKFSLFLKGLKPHTSEYTSCRLDNLGIDRVHDSEIHPLFLELRERMEAEIIRVQHEIGCKLPVREGKSVFVIFDEVQHAADGIEKKYLSIAAAEVSKLGYLDLRKMLDQMNWAFSAGSRNYRELITTRPELEGHLWNHRSEVCNHLEGEISDGGT